MSVSTTFIGSAHTHSPSPHMIFPSYNQAAGRTIVLLFSVYNTTSTPTVSDTAGNTYEIALAGFGGTNNDYTWIAFCKNCAGNASNVIDIDTVGTTSGFSCGMAYDVSGGDVIRPVYTTASGQGSSTSPLTGAFSTDTANAAILGFSNINSGYSTGSAPVIGGVSATLDANDGDGGDQGFGFHLDVTSLQSGITAGATISASDPWACVAVVIREQLGAGAFVQQNSAQSVAANCVATLSKPVVTGENIVVIVDSILSQGTCTSVTDDQSNTYTLASSHTVNSGAQPHIIQVWIAPSATGGSTLTITAHTTSAFLLIEVLHYTAATAFTYDQDASASNSGTSVTVGPTGTTTVATELVISYIVTDTGGTPTFTPGSGFTTRNAYHEATFGENVAVSDQNISSTGTQSDTWTLSTSRNVAQVLFTIALATPTPPPPSSAGASFIIICD